MTIKKFLAGSLSSVMVLSCLNVGVAALEPNALDDATINQLKATAQNEIEHFFRESDEDLYSLVGFRFDDSDNPVRRLGSVRNHSNCQRTP